MNGLAMTILQQMLDQRCNGYVFPGKGGESYLKSPKRTFEFVKGIAGLEGFRVYDLLHTFASIAVNSGSSLYEVQKLLGYHFSQMTQRKAHLGDKELRAATAGVAMQIGQAAAG